MSDKKTANNTINLEKLKKKIDGEKSRQVIADEIGCDVSLVTKHYNGQKIVTIDFLKKYALYFNVSADYFLDLTNSPTPLEEEEQKALRTACDYTGLSENTIKTFAHCSEILLGLIDFIAYELFNDELNKFIYNEDFRKSHPIWAESVYLESEALMNSIKFSNQIRKYNEQLISLGDRLEGTEEGTEASEDATYDIRYISIKKEKTEIFLNGCKYQISTTFNELLSNYIEQASYDELIQKDIERAIK